MDIDERVAREVMEWESIDYPILGWLTKKPCTLMDLMRVENWHPSTNIDQAWMVVEETREKDWYFELTQWPDGIWLAEFFESGLGYIIHGQAESDTAPMAICQAALKAKGHEADRPEEVEG